MDNQYYTDIIAALAERTIKRLWIVILVLVVLLVGTNAAWIYYESQFVVEEVSQEVEATRGNAYVVGIGDLEYGESEADGAAESTPNGR